MKVARTIEEIPELFESATREAVAAFGRGECFVERYLDKPRHVEAQVIADQHGNVVVAGTRDCSLQRRFQKLVEEAPAPFLTDAQRKEIHESAKRICKEAALLRRGHRRVPGRPGRADLLPRGQHPPAGRAPGHRGDRGHRPGAAAVPDRQRRDPGHHRGSRRRAGTAIEFRINGEDAGRGFLPAPGPVSKFDPAQRPRCAAGLRRGDRLGDRRPVRLDAGQADRLRRQPRGGAGPVAARAGRVHRRGPGHRHPVPPRDRVRPGVHRRRRRLHGAHPLDRDRVGQHRRAVHRWGSHRRGGHHPAADGRRRGRRPPPRGVAARRSRDRRRRRARRTSAVSSARSPSRASAARTAGQPPPATR